MIVGAREPKQTGTRQDVTGPEKILRDLFARYGETDRVEGAARKGLSVQHDGTVTVASFAREYRVGPDGVTAVDAKPVSFKPKLAVVSYLLSDAEGGPAGEFVPFGRLGGFNIGRERHEGKNLRGPILKEFGADSGLLARAASRIGGAREESGTPGGHVWVFHAFPQLPMRLTLHERDEEFPADVHVLFDSRALEFLGLECIGFLPEYFTDTLLDAAAVE